MIGRQVSRDLTLRRRRATTLAVAVLAALAGAAGCGGAQDELPADRLTIAGGARGGVYHDYGNGVAKAIDAHLPRLTADAVETHGSVENLDRLRAGTADIAFTRADSALEELGSETAVSRAKVVALAKLYDSYVQVVVLESSPIRQLAHLGDRCNGPCRVAVGPAGSGTRLISDRLLAAAGLGARGAVRRERRLDIQEAIAALAEKRLDAVVWAGGLPTPSIEELVDRPGVRLVGLGGVAASLGQAHPDVYAPTRVPAAVYRRDASSRSASVSTVSVANYLVAGPNLPRDAAYRLTALLFEQRQELSTAHDEAKYLDRRAAMDVYPLELHPGAARYYADAAG